MGDQQKSRPGWHREAASITHISLHIKRIVLLLLLAASTGAGLALLSVAAVHLIGGAA